jgi:peroxiredoxin
MAGVAAAMSRGEAPDCNCFGQIGSAPAGRGTLIRNTLLTAVAVFVVIQGPGTNPGSWLSTRRHSEVAVLVLGIPFVVLATGLANLWVERRKLTADLARSNATLAAFPPGLPVGAPAPGFALPTVTGTVMSLDDLRARGRPVALVFASPSCRSCQFMLADIARWQQGLSDRLTIAMIATASPDEARAMAKEFDLTNVLIQDDDAQVFHAYRAMGTPSVVIVSPDGVIATRLRASQGSVEATIRTALQTAVPTPESAIDHSTNGAGELDSPGLVVSQWSGPGEHQA